eukprot:TRINITY_DN25754_c0_g1_i2.p1 TRINITY_DN25754_c0_g1~~TRINITY_DN25754_c0_g1_i2.p1  ORF type:complete len:466 (-),score=15.68 TRINITY_DN25754_c0_g1_i2:172-1569(-)
MSSLILQGRIGGVRISLKSRKEQIKSLQGYVWNSGRSQQVVYDVDVGLRQKNRNWKVICSNSRRSSYIKRKPDINETISKISLGFLVMICVGMVLFSPSQEVPIQVFKASIMVRQQVALLLVFVTVRFMLPSLVKGVRTFFETTEPWEGSNEFHFIQQVSPPLQMMLLCASIFCLAQHVLPSLLPVSSEAIKLTSRRVLSFVCICMTAYIALCMKQRYVNSRNEYVNQKQSTVVDKIVTVLIITGTVVFFLQNLGLDLQSLLTLGGVGGIALGLAGQEILENLLHGVLIISASSFAVGDEVVFWYKDGWKVEGIVMDIGWYRSSIRSFDREVFSIPNATFSKTVVLNVTRKMGEWRIRHDFGLRLEDVRKAPQVVSAIKRILKQDKRVIQKLPIRVFLTGIDREQVNIFMNFFLYVTGVENPARFWITFRRRSESALSCICNQKNFKAGQTSDIKTTYTSVFNRD